MTEPPGRPDEVAPEALRSRAISGFGWQGGARLLAQGATWIATLVALRLMTPEAFGAFGLSMAWMAYAQALSELGLRAGLVNREVTEPPALRAAVLLSLCSAVLVAAVTIAAAPWAARWLHDPALRDVLRACALALPMFALGTVPLAQMERKLEFRDIAAVEVVSAVTSAVVTVSLAVAGYGVWSVVVGWGVLHAARTVEAWRRCRMRPFGGMSIRQTGGALRFGLWVTVDRLLVGVPNTLDAVFVGRLAGPAPLGLYTMAQGLTSSPIRRAMPLVQSVAFPIFSRLRSEPARLGRYVVRLSQAVGMLALPALVGVTLVARDLVEVFLSERWLPGADLLRALALVAVVRLLSALLIPVIQATGRPELNVRLTAISALLFPLGFWLGSFTLGPVPGVVSTLAVGYVATLVARIWILRSLGCLSVRAYGRALGPPAVATGVMVLTVLGAQLALAGFPAPLRLGVCFLVASLTYGATIAFGFPSVWREFREYLRQVLGSSDSSVGSVEEAADAGR